MSGDVQGGDPPIFEGAIPVRVKHNDLDERQASLTLRISCEAQRPSSSQKVLRVRLTDEEDPFLLFTLELNEEEFAPLKHEQRLLIDFTAFPTKLVELLQHCHEAASQHDPRFIATLVSSQAGGVLSVVETNNFRQLYHISLQLRAGNDNEIKRYLAGRVKTFKARTHELTESLEQTKEALQAQAAEADAAREEAQSLREQQERTHADVEHRANMAIAEEREKALDAQRRQQTRLETDHRERMEKQEAEASVVREQLAAASAEAKELTSDKHRLESTVHELRIKLQSAESQVEQLSSSLEATRTENRKLDAASHDTTKTIHSSNVRMATLEQQLHDKDELLEKTTALLESANGAKGQLEDTVMLLKQTVDKYDQKVKASIEEIHKGNGYIEQLSSELQAAKSKVKLKATIIRQQEQLLQEKEHTASSHSKDLSSVQAELTRAQGEVERLSAELDSKNAKLLESEQLLSTNNQVITYLNKEVNEAQLGRRQFGSSAAASTSAASRHGASSTTLGAFQPTSAGAVSSAVLAPRQATAFSSSDPATLPTVTYKPRTATKARSSTAAASGSSATAAASDGAAAAATTAPAAPPATASAAGSSKSDSLVEAGEGLMLGAGALAALQRTLEDDEYVGGSSRSGVPSSLVAGSSVAPHSTVAQN